MKPRWYWLIFLGIFVIGAGLRLYLFGSVPVSLYWDEVAMVIDARSIVETGYDMHHLNWFQPIFPSYGDFKLPVYIWFVSACMNILGQEAWVVRVPSLLAGLASMVLIVPLSFLFTQTFTQIKLHTQSKSKNVRFSQVFSLSSLFVLSVSPWSIHFSKTGFEGHLAQFFVGLSIFTTLLSLQLLSIKKSLILILCSVFFGVFASYTYFSVRFVWPVVFGTTFFIFWWKKQRFYTKKINLFQIVKPITIIFFGIFAFTISLVPLYNSPFSTQSNQYRLSTDSILSNTSYVHLQNHYRQIAGNSIIDRALFHRYWLISRDLVSNMSAHLSADFLFISGDDNLRHGTGQHGLFLLPFSLFFLIGLYKMIHNQRLLLLSLTVWWIAALIPASIPLEVPHSLRSINSLFPLSLIIGYGLASLIMALLKQILYTKNKSTLFVVKSYSITFFFVFWIFISLWQFLHYYGIVYPEISKTAWLDGYQQTAELYWQKQTQIDHFYWDVNDNKFFLWLLAYGPYTTQNIQNIEANNFLLDENDFAHISFDFDITTFNQSSNKTALIATNQDKLPEIQKNDSIDITKVYTFNKSSHETDQSENSNIIVLEIKKRF